MKRPDKTPGLFSRIPVNELVRYRDDIQRPAIVLYKMPNFFEGEPRYERWRLCIRLVADCWMRLGPQAYPSGPVIHLP